MIGKPKS